MCASVRVCECVMCECECVRMLVGVCACVCADLRQYSDAEENGARKHQRDERPGQGKPLNASGYGSKARRCHLDMNVGRMHVSNGICCGSTLAVTSEAWSRPFTNDGHGTLNCNWSAISWAWLAPSFNMTGGRLLRASAAWSTLRWTCEGAPTRCHRSQSTTVGTNLAP